MSPTRHPLTQPSVQPIMSLKHAKGMSIGAGNLHVHEVEAVEMNMYNILQGGSIGSWRN